MARPNHKSRQRHYPESDETTKGHTKKQCKNVRSTKIRAKADNKQQLTREKKMQNVYIKVHQATDTMYSDQTGRFPATSSRGGNQYIMVLVEVDENYIDAEPMKNRRAGSMVRQHQTHHTHLGQQGVSRIERGNQQVL